MLGVQLDSMVLASRIPGIFCITLKLFINLHSDPFSEESIDYLKEQVRNAALNYPNGDQESFSEGINFRNKINFFFQIPLKQYMFQETVIILKIIVISFKMSALK